MLTITNLFYHSKLDKSDLVDALIPVPDKISKQVLRIDFNIMVWRERSEQDFF